MIERTEQSNETENASIHSDAELSPAGSVNSVSAGTTAADTEPVYRYDGFISYRHGDRQIEIAQRLQRALHGFAKPFYRLRAVRLYRDETNLSANPALWPDIQRALDSSRNLILLASPEASGSPWVEREVAHWLSTRGTKGLLLVVTSGTIDWDAKLKRFDPSQTTVLPPSALSGITEEPLWIDLRKAVGGNDLRIEKPLFYDAVASLAASLRGVEKDAIAGEDIRQRRRTLGLVAIVAVLIAGLAGAFFIQQREASAQRDLAVARLFASEGFRRSQDQPKMSVSYFLSSLAVADTPNAVSGLVSLLQADPHIAMRLVPTETKVTAATFSVSGELAALGLASGQLVVWRPGSNGTDAGEAVVAGGAVERTYPGLGKAIAAIGLNEDAQRVIGIDHGGRILEWRVGSGAMGEPKVLATVPGELGQSDRGTVFASVSKSGVAVAVATYDGVYVWSERNGLKKVSVPGVAVGPVALTPNGTTLAVTLGGDVRKPLAIISLDEKIAPRFPPASNQSLGFPTSLEFDASGEHLGAGTLNAGLVIWSMDSAPAIPTSVSHPTEGRMNAGHDIDRIALGPKAEYAATLHQQRWHLWHVKSGTVLGRPFPVSASAGAFHPLERLLLTVPADTHAHVVDFSAPSLLRLGCIVAPRNLSLEEWRELAGSMPLKRPCPNSSQ